MRARMLLLGMLAGSGCGGGGVTAPDASPVDDAVAEDAAVTEDAAGPPMDPRCQPIFDALRAAAATHGAPGVGFALVVDGELACVVPHGIVEGDSPVTEDTLFRWGPTSTLVTALTTLELAASGSIDLDATLPPSLIAGFEPASWASEIRIRDLLWGVSGLPHESPLVDDCTVDGPDLGAFLSAFDAGGRVMWARPGRVAHISLVSEVMLALALEHETGRPLATLVREHVYDAAGLEDAWFGWSDELLSRGVVGYEASGGGVANSISEPRQACPAAAPRFGVTTSLRDGARLLGVLARGGVDAAGERLFSEATMASLLEPGPPSWFAGPWMRTLPGGSLIEGPAPLFHTGGFGVGNGSEIGFAPESGFGIIAFANLNGWLVQRAAVSAAVLARGYDHPLADGSFPEPWSPTREALEEYAAPRYVAPISGAEGTVEIASDGSVRGVMGVRTVAMIPTAVDVFRQQWDYRSGRVSFFRTDGVIDLAIVYGVPYAFYPEGHVPPEIEALSMGGGT